MATNNAYLNEYKKNQVETATPEQILILLYDGAIQFLNKSKVDLERKDYERFQTNLFNCEKIIIEFMNTLDRENGGDVAQNLYNLYVYFYNTLVTAGIGKNVSKIDEVLVHLKNLRDTWQKAILIAQEEKDTKLQNHVGEPEVFQSQSVNQASTNTTQDKQDEYFEYDEDDEDDEYEYVEDEDEELV